MESRMWSRMTTPRTLDSRSSNRPRRLIPPSQRVPKVIGRRPLPSDLLAIKALFNDDTFKLFPGGGDPAKLMERCSFTIVLCHAKNPEKILVHAAWDDILDGIELQFDGEIHRQNTLFLRLFVHSREMPREAALNEVMIATFASCASISNLLMPISEPGHLFFKHPRGKVVKLGEVDFIAFDKEEFFPRLNVREGREQDLDDLSPLIKISTEELQRHFKKSYLVEVISMGDSQTQSIVAEANGLSVGIICVSSDINYDLLNDNFHLEPFHGLFKPRIDDEVESHNTKSRLSVKRTPFVQDFYISSYLDTEDQEPGDSNEEQVDEVLADFRVAKRADSMKEFHLDLDEFSKELLSDTLSSAPSSVTLPTHEASQNEVYTEVGEFKPLSIEKQTLASEIVQSSLLTNLHHSLLKSEHLPLEVVSHQSGRFQGSPNAIAIQLCSIKPKLEARILDLIQGAFTAFPQKDYLIVTIPPGSRTPFWLDHFVRVAPRIESTFLRELYLIHRAALTSNLTVRRSISVAEDAEFVADFTSSLADSKRIFHQYLAAHLPENPTGVASFLMTTRSPDDEEIIVGLAITKNEPAPAYYQLNYELDDYIYFDLHDPQGSGVLTHLILNPIFQRFAKFFMREVLRLNGWTNLLHRTWSNNISEPGLLNNLEDWIPLSPRRRIDYDFLSLDDVYDEKRKPPKELLPSVSSPSGHGALLFSKKFIFEPKVPIHARIVFVGASTTNLTALGTLISSSKVIHHHLTLIDPHGLPGSLPPDPARERMIPESSNGRISEWIQRMGLGSWVSSVAGQVTRVVRDKGFVVVDHSTIVHYDILVLGVGEQFPSPDCLESHSKDGKNGKVEANQMDSSRIFQRINQIPFQNDGILKKIDAKSGINSERSCQSPRDLPLNVFTINTEMDAHFALNYITAYVPHIKDQKIIIQGACLESYSALNAILRLGISPMRILFIAESEDSNEIKQDSPLLRNLMLEKIEEFGCILERGLTFKSWKRDDQTGIASRVTFSRPDGDLTFSCLAYLPFLERRMNGNIANALAESFLIVNDGRIVINADFLTNDDKIYAAGPGTVYKKGLGAESFNHRNFASEDVGKCLGQTLTSRLDPSRSSGVASGDAPSLVRRFKSPLVRSAKLPGKWSYLLVKAPGNSGISCQNSSGEDCQCSECGCGTSLVTGSVIKSEDPLQKYFSLKLDHCGRVRRIECLSKGKFSAGNLAGIFGIHESLLDRLVTRFENGDIADLYIHFAKPWLGALFSDRWSEFKSKLGQLYEGFEVYPKMELLNFVRDFVENLKANTSEIQVDPNLIRRIYESSGLKRTLEVKLLDYLRFNRRTLPMFARPDIAQKMVQGRLESQMHHQKKET